MTGPSGEEPAYSVLSEAQRRAVLQLLRIAPVADELGALFTTAGHEIALVGGSVRDALLDRLGSDLDLSTSARPAETKDLLSAWADSVWDVGAAFGTIGARSKDGFHVEVTTYRADAYDPQTRKPDVLYGESLLGDLIRRDFTINAMAVRLPSREFVDPYGGLADLARRVLRTPSTPQSSFSDDPLRMMRAARFASQLGFEVDTDVVAAMKTMADRLAIVSAERVRDELVKLILSSRPRMGLALLVDTELALRVLPELPELRMEIDEHHRHKNVYEHTLTVLEQAIDLEWRLPGGPDLVTRLAALLHDIGKPRTRRFEPGGGVSFYHHDAVGAKLARQRLTALKFPSAVVDDVSTLVALHLRFHGYGGGEWTDSAVRRYVRDAGPLLERLHVLTRADSTTRNRRKALLLRQSYDGLETRIAQLSEQEELAAIRPDLDGHQIMAILGIPPGPPVGRAYRHLLELRLDRGPLGSDVAGAELLRWWADQPESSAG